jgi:hypothetical protein
MSRHDWNRPIYGKAWKVTQYPIRWIEVDPETGAVLSEYTGVERPRRRVPTAEIIAARPFLAE